MTQDLFLRRKWTLRAHGQQVVFVKRANGRTAHVLMKAFLWALYPIERSAPFDLLRFPADSAARFVGDRGEIRVTHDDLEWVRLR